MAQNAVTYSNPSVYETLWVEWYDFALATIVRDIAAGHGSGSLLNVFLEMHETAGRYRSETI